MAPSAAVFRWDELDLEKITELIARKTIVGAQATMTQTFLKRGALVPRHAHAAEQLVYVLQGALKARVDAETVVVREGDVWQVPAGAPHQIEALDDTFVLDIRTTEGSWR